MSIYFVELLITYILYIFVKAYFQAKTLKNLQFTSEKSLV